ncbi:MAG: phage tail tape measure protein, partial [Sulfolobaceae archaeon]
MRQVVKQLDIASTFKVNTRNLGATVTNALARSFQVSVKDFKAAFPILEGEDAFKYIMKTLYEEFSKAFYELIVRQAGLDVKELKNLLKQQDIDTTQSTQTVLNEILNRFSDLRDVLVNKIIEYVAKQFNVIIGEIEQLEIIPKTLLDHLKNQVSQLDPQQILQFVTGTSSTLPNVLTEAYIKNASFLKPGTLTSFTQFRDRIPDAYITRYGHIGYIPGLFDDTRTFTKSIVNTFRYIIAGRLIGEPLLNLMYEAFSSTFETDYELEKARQNLLAKYRGVGVTGKPFEEYAEENIRYRYEHRAELGELGIEEGLYLDPVKRRKLIERMRNQMYDLVDNGIVKALREIAISYGISQPQMATIWQISTRSQENPLNAFAMARAAMTVAAVEREEVKPEDVARAMESIVGQWQIVPGQRTKEGLTLIEKYANMVIKASLESQASAKDLLDTMSRAGAVFNAFLPQNWDKEKKFATALALSNIFIQATGRPGAEAATFFRNLIVAPYAKETMNYLIKLSQSYSDEKIRRVSPFYIEYDKEGRQITRQKDFITYLTDVINAAIRLREIGQVKEADRLLSAVFKTRQFAYEQAFESTFENMFKNFEKEGIKNFEQYIEKIQKVTQEEIDAYIGGLSRTYQFRREQLLSAFQATSMEMINALKPEFHQLMASLKGLLKYVRDNSDEVGKIVKSITEMLTAYFVAYTANKGWTKVKSEVLTNELLAHAEPWLEQEAGLVRRRHELIESTNIKAQNLETFLTLNPEIRTKINEEALKEYIPRYATYQKVSELITQNVQQFMKEFNIQDILGIFSH